jgi:F-type H+-transporting ATPase subunit b
MDNTFWATAALFILIAVMVYYKVPGLLAGALDRRGDRVRQELEDARRLRQQAQELLGELQEKRRQAEKDAADIVAAASREADMLLDEARKKTEDYVVRRTALAEQKIAQAERDAVAEVRSTAVDIAIEAARKLLAGRADGESGFQAALRDVKSNMN